MKKKKIGAVLSCVLLAAGLAAGCGSNKESGDAATNEATWESIPAATEATEASTEAATETTESADEGVTVPEGDYLSELTGLPISEDIRDQRPIAMMVDNDSRALPHFGVVDCDVVYELMNSTENNRITRLMCVMKDWGNITKLGSIRSTRPTNVILASEWNSILCHDGGPFYINDYLNQSWAPPHISGYFSRVDNGKATEFTEFCLQGEMTKRVASEGISATYTANPGNHFNFAEYGTEVTLGDDQGAINASSISLPFYNTSSTLKYNTSTNSYDYYEFGNVSQDGATGATLTFKNVIIQDCSFTQLDSNGYMIYNCVDATGNNGYYLTDGKAIPISWYKNDYSAITKFYDKNGNEITVNDGKTYIALVPSDTWGEVAIQ